jgi:hypothetical protein
MSNQLSKMSKPELIAEIRYLRRRARTDMIAVILVAAIRWLGLVAIACFAWLSIRSLSGTTTTANFALRLFANEHMAKILALLFGAGGVTYGYAQQALRRNTVHRLTNRITTLETKIDNKRSSSGLTPNGKTRPEDIP